MRSLALALAAVTGLPGATLTTDGADTYSTSVHDGRIVISAPAGNHGSNLRRVYWLPGTFNRTTSGVCATYAAESAQSVQPGTVHNYRDGRAVTVTRNVWAGAYWTFNVHVWPGDGRFTQVAQFDMSGAVFQPAGIYRPLPWRWCTVLNGRSLMFKLWFPPEPEPAWTTLTRVRSTTIPAGWQRAGKAGVYAGHIEPGGSLAYTDVRVS